MINQPRVRTTGIVIITILAQLLITVVRYCRALGFKASRRPLGECSPSEEFSSDFLSSIFNRFIRNRVIPTDFLLKLWFLLLSRTTNTQSHLHVRTLASTNTRLINSEMLS